MEFLIKKGLDIPLAGQPQQVISAGAPVDRVAFLGADFLSLRQLPRVLVAEGQRVRVGQPLIACKQHPEIKGVAPGSGIVEEIIRGKKRALKAITIRLEGDDEARFPTFAPHALSTLSKEEVTGNLLDAGLWLALRTRPFSVTPAPDSEPEALFVTATDTQPLAPSPAVIIAEAADDFVHGLHIVSRLCTGPTFLCMGAHDAVPAGCESVAKVARFSGPHPAGLAGTHIHHLMPVSLEDVVWTIDYQDVIAIGRLFTRGRWPEERVIALGGPLMSRPRLIRTRVGAHLPDLLEDELGGDSMRIISGSVLSGRHAQGWAAYLGWFHHQVCAIREGYVRELLGWIAPGTQKFSALRAFVSHWRSAQTRFDLDSRYHGSARAMVPIGVYERVMPLDLLITPLLRALLVGDIETAIDLGCLELDEEDLALCSFVCPSKHEFGFLLREVLDKIHYGS